MRDSKVIYQILIISVFLVLMSVGIYIGLQASKPSQKKDPEKDIQEASTKNVIIYSENDDKDKLEDIEIIYVDIYKECKHVLQNKVVEYGAVFSDVKERESKIALKNGYKIVKDSDGILMFEKEIDGKCSDHYLLKLENGEVVIYNIKDGKEYTKLEETEIYESSLRETYITQLKEGIKVDTAEELYMILEDMES